MRARLCSWLSILMLLAAANHAAAAGGDPYARVCVTNADGIQVFVYRPDAEKGIELAEHDANYEARIAGHETLKIQFCDKNPVLFTYSAGELKTTPLDDVAAINALGAAIGNLGNVVAASVAAKAADVAPAKAAASECTSALITSVNDIRLQDLKEIGPFVDLYGGIRGIRHAIDLTRGSDKAALLSEQTRFRDTLAGAARIRVVIEALEVYATARMTNRSIPFEAQVDKGPPRGFIQGMRTPGLSECLRNALDPVLRELDFVSTRSDELANMLDVLESFSTALLDVGSTSTAATLRYDSKTRRQQPLTISANTTFAKFFTGNTTQFMANPKKVGTITINVEPQLDLRIQVAPGVIYSFVKQPKFAAEKNDAGAFTIQQTESNYAAADAIVAVNITRDKYMHENVRPFVQIGLRPKKDELAFVLGGGIALDDANKSVLSFGAIYQERKKLAPGLSVGGTLTSADDLKTDTEFKVGFYVGVSYNLINAK